MLLLSQFIITIIATFASLETKVMISYLFAPPSCFENDFLLVLKIEIGSIFLLCLQESGGRNRGIFDTFDFLMSFL